MGKIIDTLDSTLKVSRLILEVASSVLMGALTAVMIATCFWMLFVDPHNIVITIPFSLKVIIWGTFIGFWIMNAYMFWDANRKRKQA